MIDDKIFLLFKSLINKSIYSIKIGTIDAWNLNSYIGISSGENILLTLNNAQLQLAFNWYESNSGKIFYDYIVKEIKYYEENKTYFTQNILKNIEIYGREIPSDLKNYVKLNEPTNDLFLFSFDNCKLMIAFDNLGPGLYVTRDMYMINVYINHTDNYKLIQTINYSDDL